MPNRDDLLAAGLAGLAGLLDSSDSSDNASPVNNSPQSSSHGELLAESHRCM
jgi:hypothetical protein